MAEESTTRCTLDCEELLLRNSESTPYVGNAFEVDDPDEDDKLLAGKFETTPYVGNAFEVDDPDEDDKLLAGKFETTPYVGNAFEVDDPDEDDKLLAGKFETTPYVGNAFEVDDKLLAELFETTCGEIPKSVPRDRNSSAAGNVALGIERLITTMISWLACPNPTSYILTLVHNFNLCVQVPWMHLSKPRLLLLLLPGVIGRFQN